MVAMSRLFDSRLRSVPYDRQCLKIRQSRLDVSPMIAIIFLHVDLVPPPKSGLPRLDGAYLRFLARGDTPFSSF